MKEMLKTKKGKLILGGLYVFIIIVGCILLNPFYQQTKDVTTENTVQVNKAVAKTSEPTTQMTQTTAVDSKLDSTKEETNSNEQQLAQLNSAQQGNQGETVPAPVEPENVSVDATKKHYATLSIRVDTILNNMHRLDEEKKQLIPSNGVIFPATTVEFYENENVFDVLQRVTRQSKIHLDFSYFPQYNSTYIRGIHNLYEFDCGPVSGWVYRVNGIFPNYGASRYVLKDGDNIQWDYTCEGMGKDVQ